MKTENILRTLILIGFFVIAALPLLSMPPWFSPPAWGKTLAFRTVLSILLFLSLWLLTQKGKSLNPLSYINRQSPLFLPLGFLGGLFVVYFAATLFSLDQHFSFWGDPERAWGFLNFSFYIIFALLAFLFLKAREWKKLWIFALSTGSLVSLITIFQYFGIFSDSIIPREVRPPGTLGNPILLALYLLPLAIMALSFAMQNQGKLRYLYGALAFLFMGTIFFTETRSALGGLAVAVLFFLFYFPRGIRIVKLSALILLFFGIGMMLLINIHPEPPGIFGKDTILSNTWGRLQIENLLQKSRLATWQVELQAIGNRPLLGYGPYNASIGFDKYFVPVNALFISDASGQPLMLSSWWDTAHNLFLDITLSAGFIGLLIYIGLVATLLWQLQRVKQKIPDRSIAAHGLQAAIIGYVVAAFFAFETFSTYLIFFLLIGYALHIISQSRQEYPTLIRETDTQPLPNIHTWKYAVLGILFLVILWSGYTTILKPLAINKDINLALHAAEQKECIEAIRIMESTLASNTYLNHYLRHKYVFVIAQCLPQLTGSLPEKAVELLEESAAIRPFYTRNWILLAGYNNAVLNNTQDGEEANILIQKGETYLQRAAQLSPERPEIFSEWSRMYFLHKDYKKAKEKAQECISLRNDFQSCWWYKSLSHIGLQEIKEAKEAVQFANKLGQSEGFLLQVAAAYRENLETSGDQQYYIYLTEIYELLVDLSPQNPQYHASLAFLYRELGDIASARKEAQKVIELQPGAKDAEDTADFFQSLE
ncbi:O-antigen ligase family protein [Patescibacteria group bacterium]|nr:O-antigen ligase family protein [Patescibacteria group bacterium]